MKFCPACAQPLSLLIPPEDNRPRHVCAACGTIHYINPKLIVGAIPVWEEQDALHILLCRRAILPRRGYWTLPAGFMEIGETTAEAAIRETLEEAGARIDIAPLFSIMNVVRAEQVHLFYRARLCDLDYAAGPESLEVRLFTPEAIPWEELAFPSVAHTLRLFLEDWSRVRQGGSFATHAQDF